ncbi:MAG TPA: Maf family protein [Nitrosospira sp.]|jgi:septum formation protein|nr:Maf family protein [Nitrosospira sp.]
MTFAENRIYLASRSPRRQELLKQIGVDFMVLPLREALPRIPDVDETPLPQEPPQEYVERIACVKAQTGRMRASERGWAAFPVLGADTAVVSNGRIFGKPENPLHAKEMLRALSGQVHEVLTAVAVAAGNGTRVNLSRSRVRFRNISEQEIAHYLTCGEAYDKAGAYAIQGRAAVFISEIFGSYSGVVGLPLFETAQLLEESGIRIFQ